VFLASVMLSIISENSQQTPEKICDKHYSYRCHQELIFRRRVFGLASFGSSMESLPEPDSAVSAFEAL